jgi:hypothetical protein
VVTTGAEVRRDELLAVRVGVRVRAMVQCSPDLETSADQFRRDVSVEQKPWMCYI